MREIEIELYWKARTTLILGQILNPKTTLILGRREYGYWIALKFTLMLTAIKWQSSCR